MYNNKNFYIANPDILAKYGYTQEPSKIKAASIFLVKTIIVVVCFLAVCTIILDQYSTIISSNNTVLDTVQSNEDLPSSINKSQSNDLNVEVSIDPETGYVNINAYKGSSFQATGFMAVGLSPSTVLDGSQLIINTRGDVIDRQACDGVIVYNLKEGYINNTLMFSVLDGSIFFLSSHMELTDNIVGDILSMTADELQNLK